jgi:hypothetical protein
MSVVGCVARFVVGNGPLQWLSPAPGTWIGCCVFGGIWVSGSDMGVMQEGAFQASVDAKGFGFLATWVLVVYVSSVGGAWIPCVVVVAVLPVVCRVLACACHPSVVV